MTKPRRIQRQRTKGWRMPPNTIYVGRPGPLGNPWTLERAVTDAAIFDGIPISRADAAEVAVSYFRAWLAGEIKAKRAPVAESMRQEVLSSLPKLRGKNLACWCALDQPCHADVLLELANQ